MNGAIPIRHDGKRGPYCGSAFAACVWILQQADWRSWDWRPAAPEEKPADPSAEFNPVSALSVR